MDWNWFFSALAQSAAAIVGIFAAFIVTKIINNQMSFTKKSNQLRAIPTDCERFAAQLGARYVEWYNEQTWAQTYQNIKKFVPENKSADLHTVVKQAVVSPYEEPTKIVKTIRLLRDNQGTIEDKVDAVLTSSRPMLEISPKDHFFESQDNLDRQNKRLIEIQNERDEIDKVVLEIDHQCKQVRMFLLQIENNPERSGIVNALLLSLVLLFYAGVIYPLSFLPVPTEGGIELSISAFWDVLFSMKGVILAIVSVIFNAIILVFIFLNSRLKYDEEQIEELRRLTEPQNYSKFLKNRHDNLYAPHVDS